MKSLHSYLWQVEHGKRFTRSIDIAIEVAKKTGKPPIEYISPALRETYRKAYPNIFGRKK